MSATCGPVLRSSASMACSPANPAIHCADRLERMLDVDGCRNLRTVGCDAEGGMIYSLERRRKPLVFSNPLTLLSWFVVVRRTMSYSYLKATMGSTRVARRAGI